MNNVLMLLVAGVFAGAMNALAGGGSFVTLPALIAAGVPSVLANASSTVALYPGGAMSAWILRDGLTEVSGVPIKPALLATLAGGAVGAVLLIGTSSSLFDGLLPWLLLTATLTLAFGPMLGPSLRSRVHLGRRTVIAVQFLLGIYGGYFGGAVGLMMMAAWSMLLGVDMKTASPARTLMVTVANTVAVLCFTIAQVVRWPQTLVVAAGAIIGGYAGARLGRRLPAKVVRVATLLFAAGITVAFFVRAHLTRN
jgi:uncharacterized membrane protein YfcA